MIASADSSRLPFSGVQEFSSSAVFAGSSRLTLKTCHVCLCRLVTLSSADSSRLHFSSSSAVQQFRSSGVQQFRSSAVQEFSSSGVQQSLRARHACLCQLVTFAFEDSSRLPLPTHHVCL